MSLHTGIDQSSVSGRAWLEGRLREGASQIQALFTAGILGGGLSESEKEEENVEENSAESNGEDTED